MIVHDLIQGSPEWFKARLGIPTGSSFEKILTPTGKISSQSDGYENRLVAEILTGDPIDDFAGTVWTERGNELEPEAVAYYEMTRGVETQRVGFVTDDERTFGASPDRLVGEDGILEIKCPAPHTHVTLLLEQNVDQKYYPQIQGQLMVTGRKWVDILSYHPKMPKSILRVERDEKYIAMLRDLLGMVRKNVDAKVAKVKGLL